MSSVETGQVSGTVSAVETGQMTAAETSALSQQKKARSNPLQGAVPGLVLEVQVEFTMSVRAQIIENGPNRV